MSAPRHAPGPWQFVQGGTGDNPTWHVRIWPSPASVVNLPGIASMEEMDGTAYLIAAAPDLLQALRVLLSWTPSVSTFDRMGFDTTGPLKAIAGARSAIAKATTGSAA